jgi:hypothetical protein
MILRTARAHQVWAIDANSEYRAGLMANMSFNRHKWAKQSLNTIYAYRRSARSALDETTRSRNHQQSNLHVDSREAHARVPHALGLAALHCTGCADALIMAGLPEWWGSCNHDV